jgi:hypothetical protein
MLATVLVLCLVVVAFWRSVFKFVIAALLVLLVVGGIQAVQAIDAIVTVNPQQQIH